MRKLANLLNKKGFWWSLIGMQSLLNLALVWNIVTLLSLGNYMHAVLDALIIALGCYNIYNVKSNILKEMN